MSIPYWVFKRSFNIDTLEKQEGFSESPFLDGLEIFFRSLTSIHGIYTVDRVLKNLVALFFGIKE